MSEVLVLLLGMLLTSQLEVNEMAYVTDIYKIKLAGGVNVHIVCVIQSVVRWGTACTMLFIHNLCTATCTYCVGHNNLVCTQISIWDSMAAY